MSTIYRVQREEPYESPIDVTYHRTAEGAAARAAQLEQMIESEDRIMYIEVCVYEEELQS